MSLRVSNKRQNNCYIYTCTCMSVSTQLVTQATGVPGTVYGIVFLDSVSFVIEYNVELVFNVFLPFVSFEVKNDTSLCWLF